MKLNNILLIIIFLTILVNFFIFNQNEPCFDTEEVNASIEVVRAERNVVGFNTEKDSLKFGRVSPGSSVRREIKTRYSKETNVKINTIGELGTWILITPQEFHLPKNTQQRVFFEAKVPEYASSGNYTSQIIFCFD